MKTRGIFVSAVLASAFVLFATAPVYAAGQTCTWNGSAGDYLFSSASNWSNCSGSVPTDSDDLLFDQWVGVPNSGSSNAINLTNDLSGIEFNDITTTGIGSAGNYYVIDTATVNSGSVLSGSDAINIIVENLMSPGQITLNGAIIGTNVAAANLIVSGNSSVYGATVRSMTIQSGSDLVGAVDASGNFSFANLNDITIQNGAKLFVCGTSGFASIDADIVFGGGTGANPSIELEPCTGSVGGSSIPSVGAEFKGEITLLSDATINISNKRILMNNTLVANGHHLAVNTNGSSVIMGKGVLGDIALTNGSRIAPGMSPGCLTSGNISWVAGAVYSFEVGGLTACTQYDQISVVGTVNLGNGTLEATPYGGFAPSVDNVFTIISNDGTDAISGTFNNLTEGSQFTQNGVTYRISYVGGDGNDVTLTVQNVPAVPDTGFALLTSNSLYTIVTATIAAGMLVVIARRLQKNQA